MAWFGIATSSTIADRGFPVIATNDNIDDRKNRSLTAMWLMFVMVI